MPRVLLRRVAPGPRGAATDASFARQQSKIVTGINRLGASIVTLEEVENSAWFNEPRDTAVAGLVAALNAAAGISVWAYVPSPPADRLPPLTQQDVIRTALIYKPAAVSPVGASTVLLGDADPGEPFSIARERVAQGFKKTGASDSDAFLVVVNRFKSKGSGPALFPGDAEDTSSPAADQGAFNATRVREAQDLNAFAALSAEALGTNRVFLTGDFNAYTHEDPMETLYAAGYTDLGSALDPSEHTYVFDSLSGSLDHVLANTAARQLVTGVDVWQINAQEPDLAGAVVDAEPAARRPVRTVGADRDRGGRHRAVDPVADLHRRRHGRLPGQEVQRTVVDP